MKKSVKRKCKRTKHNKCTTHHMHKKTHHKRLRSQRGGTIEQAYDYEITRCIACTDPDIQNLMARLFTGCLMFRKLLEARSKQTPSLKQIVCGQLTDVQIRKAETWFGLQCGIEIWPEFVIRLTRMVKSVPTGITMMPPSSKPEKEDWRPVMVPRPILPEGWTQSGPPERPIYFTSSGQGQYEFPTMPAREFELAQRLEQIRDPNYIPPPLTEKDQASAKQADALLPNLPSPSVYDKMMAFRLDN